MFSSIITSLDVFNVLGHLTFTPMKNGWSGSIWPSRVSNAPRDTLDVDIYRFKTWLVYEKVKETAGVNPYYTRTRKTYAWLVTTRGKSSREIFRQRQAERDYWVWLLAETRQLTSK